MAQIGNVSAQLKFKYNVNDEETGLIDLAEFTGGDVNVLTTGAIFEHGEVTNYIPSGETTSTDLGKLSIILSNSDLTSIAAGTYKLNVPNFTEGNFQFVNEDPRFVQYKAGSGEAQTYTGFAFDTEVDVPEIPAATDESTPGKLEIIIPVKYTGSAEETAELPAITVKNGENPIELGGITELKSVFAKLAGQIVAEPTSTSYGEKVTYTITLNNSGNKAGIVPEMTLEFPKECDIDNAANTAVKIDETALVKDTDYSVVVGAESNLDTLTISKELTVPAKVEATDGVLNIVVECIIKK